MNFANKVCALRMRDRLSQAELAEALNVSRQTVSKWELGASYPEIDKLLALSELFQVSTDYLLKDRETLPDNSNLDRLVLEFLGTAQDMDGLSKELVDIARDGVIDARERLRLDSIVDTLNAVANSIEEIKHRLWLNRKQTETEKQ
ncbi:MAG: helix-turn-helix transcriptional regulator [Lachnospiraceae bacterium]|nr:helix-turn-helix transcriptional regulator [Lachnospiraceae bacterium]